MWSPQRPGDEMSNQQTGWTLRRAGPHGLLIETTGPASARRLTEWLRASEFAAHLEDVIPAARTVLVRAPHGLDELAQALRDLPSTEATAAVPSSTVEIPVDYCGEDLDDVCDRAGVGRARFVAEHTTAEHIVAFFGFTPGFAYIAGIPEP